MFLTAFSKLHNYFILLSRLYSSLFLCHVELWCRDVLTHRSSASECVVGIISGCVVTSKCVVGLVKSCVAPVNVL